MPRYPGTTQVVELKQVPNHSGWETEYAAYLAEREAEQSTPQKTSLVEDSWEAQYAAYLQEKEAIEFARYEARTEDL
jgi:hypothetical protein